MSDFRGYPNYPRGMRNNNPGNFRPFYTYSYVGQTGVDPSGYAIFSDMSFGARAMALQVMIDVQTHGFNTLAKLIHSWAPASDGNDEVMYRNYVANKLGIGVNDPIPLDPTNFAKLLRAMIDVEEGVNYSNKIPQSDLLAGINMLPSAYTPTGAATTSAGTGNSSLPWILGAGALIAWGVTRSVRHS